MRIDGDLNLEENNLKIWVLLVSFVMCNGLPYKFFLCAKYKVASLGISLYY